jgi:ATP-binding cassette subfamily B (MDR/TAP) protein 1
MIYKQISWFDSKDRPPGVLSNILSEDISALNGLTTETYSIMLEAFFTLAVSIALACLFNWKLALITLALSPFVILGGIATNKLMWKGGK